MQTVHFRPLFKLKMSCLKIPQKQCETCDVSSNTEPGKKITGCKSWAGDVEGVSKHHKLPVTVCVKQPEQRSTYKVGPLMCKCFLLKKLEQTDGRICEIDNHQRNRHKYMSKRSRDFTEAGLQTPLSSISPTHKSIEIVQGFYNRMSFIKSIPWQRRRAN